MVVTDLWFFQSVYICTLRVVLKKSLQNIENLAFYNIFCEIALYYTKPPRRRHWMLVIDLLFFQSVYICTLKAKDCPQKSLQNIENWALYNILVK